MKRGLTIFIACTVVIAAAPFVADNYVVRLCTFLCMYAALALSWNVIGGYAGYPSFSTAGFFGLGAYAGALLQHAGVTPILSWLAATVVVAALAASIGRFILRMKGHYFAIGSLAIVEVLRLVASSWASLTGGGDGLNVPILQGGPDFIGRIFLFSMMAMMIVCFAMTVLVDRTRLGFGLRCIKQNEDAADMVGIDVTSYKTAAFALSAMFCGTIGAIYASWVAYIDPSDAFSTLLSLKVPVMTLLGGPGTVLGPVVGAWIFVILEEIIWAQFLELNRAILGDRDRAAHLRAAGRAAGPAAPGVELACARRAAQPRAGGTMSTAVLEVDNLSRAFGGVQAVDGVSFALHPGEIVGLIGPNGAGKTTLVNLVTGVVSPSSGTVRFDGRDVTRQRPWQAARNGLARTFQVVQPFPEMTVLENVAAGALFAGQATSRAEAEAAARDHLSFVGLAYEAHRPAAALPLPGRKRLELAKSLAMKPKVLLLDEVNAGLNSGEVDARADADARDRRPRHHDSHHRAPHESRADPESADPRAAPRETREPGRPEDGYPGPGRRRGVSRTQVRRASEETRPWLNRCSASRTSVPATARCRCCGAPT